MIRVVFILVVLIIFFALVGCTHSTTYGPYYGKVVDAETKEPLEGAAVLVVFYTNEAGPAGSITRFADALEMVTDKEGEFTFSEHKVTSSKFLYLLDSHGYFTIFKPGYGHYPDSRGVKPMFVPNGSLLAKQYLTIELPSLKTREERKKEGIPNISGAVPYEKQLKLIELVNKEREFLGYPGKIEKKAWDLLKE